MNRRIGVCTGACAAVVACAMATAWWMHATGASESEADPVGAKAPPKVVVEETEHDFGFLDASDPGRHVFSIRNEGAGPLRLARGGTSCKCTMSHLPADDIPPGATAEVELSTKYTATKDGVFRHTANILTNDPKQGTVTLTVRGVYRAFLAAKPERIEFPQTRQDNEDSEPLRAEVTLYSQAYEHFDLTSLSATLDGVAWEIEPLEADVLAPLEAKSGYRIAMVLPDKMPDTSFSHTLHVSAMSAGEGGKPRTLAIPLSRRSPGSVELFGPDLTLGRALLLGTVLPGNVRRSLLTLKVGVEPRELNIRSIEVEPAFVQVRVAPLKPDTPQLGLYRVEVEVPHDSPMGNYRGPTAGSIRIETDHPRVPEVNLSLEFAVAGT